MTTENHVQGLKPGLASIHACEIKGQDRFQGPLAAHRNHTASRLYSIFFLLTRFCSFSLLLISWHLLKLIS